MGSPGAVYATSRANMGRHVFVKDSGTDDLPTNPVDSYVIACPFGGAGHEAHSEIAVFIMQPRALLHTQRGPEQRKRCG